MRLKLTDKLVRELELPATGNRRIPDSEYPSLNALVTAAGWRGFVMRYRINGRQRQMTIGDLGAWAVTAARVRAKELRKLIDQGIDPLEQEAKARDEAITLAEYWRNVYEPLHVARKRPSWARDIHSMMARDLLPKLGKRLVKEIDGADVAALHRHISKRAPARANRVLAVLSHLMTYAERPHVLESAARVEALRPRHSNPCQDITRNPEEARQRYLTAAELKSLADVLAGHPERLSVALVRFLLLTGARFTEAAHATWNQFDLERGVWTKPSSHTKQKREHVVPLAAPALALLQELRAQNGSSPHLFPGSAGKPITTIKTMWRSVTRQAGLTGVRVHDLRHTHAALLASGGASLLLIGQLLGHTQIATTKRYAHLHDDAQRAAVEQAAALITGQPSAEVVRLRR